MIKTVKVIKEMRKVLLIEIYLNPQSFEIIHEEKDPQLRVFLCDAGILEEIPVYRGRFCSGREILFLGTSSFPEPLEVNQSLLKG